MCDEADRRRDLLALAALLIASYNEQDLAGIMIFAAGDTAWYLYGASTNTERNRMPTYAVQWAAIQWARARGCTIYDLWGVPDADEDVAGADFGADIADARNIAAARAGTVGVLVLHVAGQ